MLDGLDGDVAAGARKLVLRASGRVLIASLAPSMLPILPFCSAFHCDEVYLCTAMGNTGALGTCSGSGARSCLLQKLPLLLLVLDKALRDARLQARSQQTSQRPSRAIQKLLPRGHMLLS